MRNLYLAGAGALSLLLAAPSAFAQSGYDLGTPPPASGPQRADSTTRYFVAESIPTDGTPPRALRDIRDVTEDSAIVEERWYRTNYPTAASSFDANHRMTVSLCRTTGGHLAEAEELVRLFTMLSPIFVDLYRELEALRPQIGRGAWIRRGFELVGVAIGFLTSGLGTAGIVAANALGYEGSASVHDGAMDVNTRITMANVLVTLVNIRSQLLQLNVMSDYLYMTNDACGAANMYEPSTR